ncbi:MAG: hypothetical protein IKF38_05635 [Clostridia bacterium]|nr:hypothetical protein [Clostridia bacterium]
MINYEKQEYANILALLTAEDFAEKKMVLENVCRAFDRAEVTWALAMSSCLFFRGIMDDFNDIDILIALEDVEEFEIVFRKLGGKIDNNTVQKPAFTSPYYKEATFGGMHFDLIGNMTVNTYGTVYQYVLKQQDVEYLTIDGDVNIPLSPVEANFLLYGMMEGWQTRRRFKKDLCFQFLKEKGLAHPEVFERLLNGQKLLNQKTGKFEFNSVSFELLAKIEQLK